jgi:hypothetical protein
MRWPVPSLDSRDADIYTRQDMPPLRPGLHRAHNLQLPPHPPDSHAHDMAAPQRRVRSIVALNLFQALDGTDGWQDQGAPQPLDLGMARHAHQAEPHVHAGLVPRGRRAHAPGFLRVIILLARHPQVDGADVGEVVGEQDPLERQRDGGEGSLEDAPGDGGGVIGRVPPSGVDGAVEDVGGARGRLDAHCTRIGRSLLVYNPLVRRSKRALSTSTRASVGMRGGWCWRSLVER